MPAATGMPEIITRIASGDMRNFLYHLVAPSGANDQKIRLASPANGVLGVLHTLRMGRDGETAGVGVLGHTKVIAGGAVPLDSPVATNGSGRAVAASSGSAVIGRATQVASAEGDYFEIYLSSIVK